MKRYPQNYKHSGYWQKMLVKSIKDDLSVQHRKMTIAIIKQGDGLLRWVSKNAAKLDALDNFIRSVKAMDNIDYAQLIIAVKQSNMLLE